MRIPCSNLATPASTPGFLLPARPAGRRTSRPSGSSDLARQNLAALAALEPGAWHPAVPHLFRGHPAGLTPGRGGDPWAEALAAKLAQAGALIAETGARVSMHPGQYTVLNSPRAGVVEAALAELEYHAAFLDLLGAPLVFDVFHHTYNPSLAGCALREIIERCAATWKAQDGPPKVHSSDQ